VSDEATTYTELLHTDLDATGAALAERLHAALAQELDNSFTEALIANRTEDEWADNNLIVPGLAFQTTRHLSALLAKAAEGWEEVFWRNLKERYDATGEA
jgi:hypothetical protein